MKKLIIVFVLLFILPISVFADELNISGNAVAIRNAPTTVNSLIVRVNSGSTYTLKSSTIVADQGKNGDCDGGWYNIDYKGQSAYVCAKYGIVKTTSTPVISVEAKNQCEQELKTAGFPQEYWNGLCTIKATHPNWQFNAVQTGYNFVDVVNEEAKCGKNTIATKNQEYVDNTCTKSLDSGYSHASQKAVAYYMNPLNFLDEKHIFMFESNYRNTSITLEANNAIISNRLSSYVKLLPVLPNAINTACNEKNVSPSFIAARIRQELGSTGKATSGAYKGQLLSCISGAYTTRWNKFDEDGTSLNYYYNFFNVGVYDGSNGDAAYRAVVAAKKRGWGGTGNQAQDVTKAIGGGAEFLKKGYIDNAQHTMYFQKFNVSPVNKNAIFSHQYMTNLTAPSSEASSVYSSYKAANLLNNNFIFYIPVYSNLNAVITNSPDGATGESGTNTSNGLSVPSIITSTGFKISGNKITGIEPGMSLDQFKAAINSVGGVVTSSTSNVIGTGTTLAISNGRTQEQYTIVIKGDTSGDGAINVLDLLQIQKSILGQTTLNEYAITGADVSGDGKISVLDLLQIQKSILGQSKINQ